MSLMYSSEENVQILISILKQNNIKRVIASPGATNISFVASIQNDSFFEVYSCVDERSASYLACGMAAKSNEPVVLTCTGATASRNYIPGLTEAFYRKLPIIAITSTQNIARVGQGVAQVLDRSNISNDIAKISVFVPIVSKEEDRWMCNLNINRAVLESKRNGGGPVHINLESSYCNDYNVENIPLQRKIERIENSNKVPLIEEEKVAIFINQHAVIKKELEEEIEKFCEIYNGVVLCDQTSNYNGKYKILPNLICNQESYNSTLKNIELLIEIGNISGAYTNILPKRVWRVNPDGEIRDRFQKLTFVFQMEEIEFFKKYNKIESKNRFKLQYYQEWKLEYERIYSKLNGNKLPFSNIWIAKEMISKIPNGAELHLAILNTLRSWNYYSCDKNIDVYANTGGFGIDGIISTLIGSSYVDKKKNVYGIVGDLAFFYDMNSLGIRDVGNNIRLMIINNGGGTEFHNYNHRARSSGERVGEFISADGHYGNKSRKLIREYAENLGFEYITVNDKEEFLNKINYFINNDSKEKSIIFEVFTNSEEESKALEIINHLEMNGVSLAKSTVKKTINKIIRKK